MECLNKDAKKKDTFCMLVWLSPCNGSIVIVCNSKSYDTCKLLILDV